MHSGYFLPAPPASLPPSYLSLSHIHDFGFIVWAIEFKWKYLCAHWIELRLLCSHQWAHGERQWPPIPWICLWGIIQWEIGSPNPSILACLWMAPSVQNRCPHPWFLTVYGCSDCVLPRKWHPFPSPHLPDLSIFLLPLLRCSLSLGSDEMNVLFRASI